MIRALQAAIKFVLVSSTGMAAIVGGGAGFSAFVPRATPQQAVTAARHPTDSSFRHSIHKSLECTTCHGTSTTHGEIKIVAPGGCLACHHSAEQRVPCASCHKTETFGPYPVPVTFNISARRDPVTRPLTFTHTRHATLECSRCHANNAKRTVTQTCTTCHTEHHTAAANCASCHPTARVGHDRSVHAGCAGCHTAARLAGLPTGRPLCILCHQDKSNHYPARDCATCHALDPNAMLRSARPGSGLH